MKLSRKEYDQYARRMESDPVFGRRYIRLSTCGERRSAVRGFIGSSLGHFYATDVEDGEQLRRYLDDLWSITSDPEGQCKYDDLPNIWDQHISEPKPRPRKAAPVANFVHSTLTKEDLTMTKTSTPIEVTTKTLVNGTDVSTMTDSEVYALIASEEARIEDLKKIKAQPKRLVAEIDKRQAGINALVAYLDSKE